MIIDCVSDLHGYFPDLEGGDLLIVAGDLTARDERKEYEEFDTWLHEQKYVCKIVVAGNHDNLLLNPDNIFRDDVLFTDDAVEYLCDSGTEYKGLKIWGSPWTTTFPGMNPHCMAFTCKTDEELFDNHFEKIPHDIDILITHSPPKTIGDLVKDQPNDIGRSCGSGGLYGLLKYAFRPKLHVFGHIHEGYGRYEVFPGYNDTMVQSVNASYVNQYYHPCNKPIRIILDDITPVFELQK